MSYFVDNDAWGDPCLWYGTGPDDPRPSPVVRKCEVPPEVWRAAVEKLAGLDSGAEYVYRMATADGQLAGRGYGSGLKKLYPDLRGARLARQHYPRGSKIQRAAVVWSDVE